MSTHKFICFLWFCFISAQSTLAGGAYRLDANGDPIGFDTNAVLRYHIDSGPLNATFSNETASELVREAFEAWNQVQGSMLRISENATARRDYRSFNDAGIGLATGFNPIVFDADGSFLASVGYASDTPAAGLPINWDGSHHLNFLAVINGPAVEGYSAQRLKGLMIQVFGTCLGLSFSSVNGPYIGEPNGPDATHVAMMFPHDFEGARPPVLQADDRAGFLALYGASSHGDVGLGSVSGRITMSNGQTPAGGINVIARLVDDPFVSAYATISNAHTGAFKLVGLQPGSYTIEVADIGKGVGQKTDAIHGLPIRTSYDLKLANITLGRSYRARILGEFPGETEYYSGNQESNDPELDPATNFEAVQVRADQETTDIHLLFNRDAAKPWTQLLYPWISNRANEFESVLVVNNFSDSLIEVTLTGIRNAQDQETVLRTIQPKGMLEERASTLFPTLGSGGGYAVKLLAPTDQIAGRWLTNSLRAESGASPSQGVAVRIPNKDEVVASDRVGQKIILGYLPADSELISAPVLVNLDPEPADLTLTFYNQTGEVVAQTTIANQPPYQPLAQITRDYLTQPEDVYVIAETSGNAITGASFVFDPFFFETAIGNASSIDPNPQATQKLVYPWISNRANQFESILVLNNLSQQPVDVQMIARRGDGSTESVNRSIPALGFLSEKASTLFPELGDGSGYTIEATTDTGEIRGQWVTNNLTSQSGRSPSQGVAVAVETSLDRKGTDLILGYLPITQDFLSGLVFVNLGDANTDVDLEFFDGAGNLILKDVTTLRGLKPNQPSAPLANHLLPEQTENVYLVAKSDNQPITAVVFFFNNRFLEPAIGNATAITPSQSTSTAFAFTNVTLVPMDHEGTIPGQTVLVRDAKIIAIGTDITLPEDAEVIDGTGKFLMPGLNDTHTHMASEKDLVLQLANGVTGVLNMGDFANEMIRMKHRVARGDLVGPTIYAAQFFRGAGRAYELSPTNPEEARQLARDSIAAGYDYLKVYTGLSEAVLNAVIDEGRLHGVTTIGHLQDRAIPLDRVLLAGQKMVAHVEEYLNGFFQPEFNEAQISAAREMTLAHGAYVTTTLSVIEALSIYGGANFSGYAQLLQRQGVPYIEPWEREYWNYRVATSTHDQDRLQQQLDFIKRVTLDFAQGGVKLLAGTDAPAPGLVSGFAIHEELRLLVQAGLSPFQALQTATRNVGDFVEETLSEVAPFGTLTVGHRADLLLLNSNPLQSVQNVQDRAGVMARGQWFSQATLSEMLEQVKVDHQNQKSDDQATLKTCEHH